jgi:hypothetical protein
MWTNDHTTTVLRKKNKNPSSRREKEAALRRGTHSLEKKYSGGKNAAVGGVDASKIEKQIDFKRTLPFLPCETHLLASSWRRCVPEGAIKRPFARCAVRL